jgi:hypothetical protein
MITDDWSVSKIGSNSHVHQRQTCASGHSTLRLSRRTASGSSAMTAKLHESMKASSQGIIREQSTHAMENLYMHGIIGFKVYCRPPLGKALEYC